MESVPLQIVKLEKAEQFSSSEEVEEEEEQGDSNSLLLLEETENSSDMDNQNTRREEEHSDEKSGINLSTRSQTVEHRVYPIRWFMLAAMIVLNISNGMMWLTFAPVPSLTAEYYQVTLSDVDWFSQSYFVASLLIGFIAIGVLDVVGLRIAVFLGAFFNLFGAILRYISTVHPILCSSIYDKSGFMVAMIGQIISSFAQPFLLYAPTKLANTWFGSKERGLCTNLASVANPIGIAVAQLLSPHIVTETSEVPTMLWIYILPAGLGAILSLFYYRDHPPVTPSASGDIKHEPFFKGLKKTILNWNFVILLLFWGIASGMLSAFLIIIPQYLCPYGYSNQDVGLWGSLLVFCGLAGATIAAILIDYTKLFKEIGVVAFTFAIACLIWFVEVATIENEPVLVAFPLCLFGFFGFSLLPISMELGIEITYPVSEATSSGLLWSASQITGIIFVSLGQVLVQDISHELHNNQCGVGLSTANSTFCGSSSNSTVSDNSKPGDWTNGGLLLVGMLVIAYILFTLILRPTYKRLEVEKKAKRDKEEREDVFNSVNQ